MLNFFYGTMFAGKTLHLIQAKEIYNRKGINAVVLKKDTDTREAHADDGLIHGIPLCWACYYRHVICKHCGAIKR